MINSTQRKKLVYRVFTDGYIKKVAKPMFRIPRKRKHAGIVRVGKTGANEIRFQVDRFLQGSMKYAAIFAQNRGKKTITEKDMKRAFNIMGQKLLGSMKKYKKSDFKTIRGGRFSMNRKN